MGYQKYLYTSEVNNAHRDMDREKYFAAMCQNNAGRLTGVKPSNGVLG